MAPNDTVERILHAATLLFAERGFAETSLRTITGMAEVNLAAVNYHFGSKKALIQAVFERFLSPFCEQLNRALDNLEADVPEGQHIPLETLLDSMFDTLLKTTAQIHEDPQIFMRLLGLAYTQSQEHLRKYIVGAFGQTYSRFVGLIQRVCPKLSQEEFYWRLYFMLGAAVFTLSGYDSIRAILNADFNKDTSLSSAIDLMTPSVAAMLKAPNVQ